MPPLAPIETTQSAMLEVFSDLAARADDFENYPNAHARRICAIADQLGKSFFLGPRDRFSLRVAALAHDLGEVAMNRDYIHRDGALSDNERMDLARHPLFSEREAATAGADRGAQLLVRWHHEWWNGSGYPDGLVGDEIPLAARILRAADSYAALTASRPFRTALSVDETRKYITEWAAIEFDPKVARVLLDLDMSEA